MKSPLALSVVLLVSALPLVAAAQTPAAPSNDLQIERKQRRPVVLPKPSPEQARADAERAVDEYSGRTPDQVVRETSPVRPPARPDLDYDVTNGIQSQRLNKELFKR
jgi:hypothetical protein